MVYCLNYGTCLNNMKFSFTFNSGCSIGRKRPANQRPTTLFSFHAAAAHHYHDGRSAPVLSLSSALHCRRQMSIGRGERTEGIVPSLLRNLVGQWAAEPSLTELDRIHLVTYMHYRLSLHCRSNHLLSFVGAALLRCRSVWLLHFFGHRRKR